MKYEEYEELKTYAKGVAAALVAAERQHDCFVSGQGPSSQRFTPSAWRIALLPLELRVTDTPAGWAVTHQQDQEVWLQRDGALYVMNFSCAAGPDGTTRVTSAASSMTPEIARRFDRARSLKVGGNGTWTFEDTRFLYSYPFRGLIRMLTSVYKGNSPQAQASMGALSDPDRMAAAGIFLPPPDAAAHPGLLTAFEDLQVEAAALANELLARGRPRDSYVSDNAVSLEGWRVNTRNETCCLITEAGQGFRSSYYKQTDVEIWLLSTGSLVQVEFSMDRAHRGGSATKAKRAALTVHTALRLDRNREFKETRERRGSTVKDWEYFDESELRYSQPLTGIRLALTALRQGERTVGIVSQGHVG